MKQPPRIWPRREPPTLLMQTAVCRVSGYAQALRMPPAVMAAIATIYGEGGHPARQQGRLWRMDTFNASGAFGAITDRSTRLRLRLPVEGVPQRQWPMLTDTVIVFGLKAGMARRITAREAADAAQLPMLFVESATRGQTGSTPGTDDAYNGIALRALLIAFCKDQRKQSRNAREIWEERAYQIERSEKERWCQ